MRKLAVAAILGLVLFLLLSSAVPARATHGDASGLYGGNLRVAVRGAISLNPFTATDADSWKVIPLVYDSLARIDPATLTPTLWAASSWSISGTTLTATLRSDLKFTDGTAVGGADVVYSYNQYKTVGRVPADLAATNAGNTVTLSSASGGGLLFGQGLTLPIVKAGSVANPVGSGPWRLTSPPSSTSWTLTANAAHFRPPYLETVTFSVYSSTTSAATALLSGSLDFIGWGLLVDEPSQIINIGGVNKTLLSDATIVQNPGLRQLSFGFNMRSTRVTSDAGLRSALAVTLNPILYRQLYPSTIISRSPVIQEDVPWYNPAVPTYQVTITLVGTPPRSTALLTQSLQLLDNAGYVDRDGDGWRERPNGSPLSLTVVGIPVTEDARTFTIQEATVDVFTRLGIHATLVSVPSATILSTLAAGNYDVFAATLDTTLDPGFLWDYVHSSGALNVFGVVDSTLDADLSTANAALASTSRATAVLDAQMRTMTKGFFVPVLHFNAIEAAVRGSFDGWVSMPGGVNNFWTFQNLHVTQLGPLAATLTVIPTAVTAGQTTTAIATVKDSQGAPVSGANVSFWIGGSQVASGTTDLAGTLSTPVTAPSAQGATDVQVTIQASKLGYAGATTSAWMTVTSDTRALAVGVSSSAVTIPSGGQSTITVTVTSSGSPVSGATVSLQVIGLGGRVTTASGATDAQGHFTTAFSADVGPRTQFRVVATATAPGYVESSGSTTVVAEQRVGTVEPRVTAGLDTSTIIVAVLALVVIAALAAMMGRRK
ncbi:MAG TPA: ABC transporter substrate-binding protein [Thermoplasmata archaeon]|nr:ABC transporter substrate-binding protein [Thermoplasmata archaeon]